MIRTDCHRVPTFKMLGTCSRNRPHSPNMPVLESTRNHKGCAMITHSQRDASKRHTCKQYSKQPSPKQVKVSALKTLKPRIPKPKILKLLTADPASVMCFSVGVAGGESRTVAWRRCASDLQNIKVYNYIRGCHNIPYLRLKDPYL